MDKIGNPQFHVMCEMCGVDNAIKAAKRMGMVATEEQINEERKREQEQTRRWDKKDEQ